MIDPQNWMAAIEDTRPLASLCIPGTHDTMTSSCSHPYYKTQQLSLSRQLEAGVRFLDIRLGRDLMAAHREWHSDISGATIFETLKAFLQKNSEEVVFVRIQNANEAKDDYPEYGEALRGLVDEFWDLMAYAKQSSTQWGNIGQYRGKLIALECSPVEFEFCSCSYGNWARNWHENPMLFIQDLWDGPSLEDKKQAIVQAIELEAPEVLVLNHFSATNGDLGTPIAYASRLNEFAEQHFRCLKDKSRRPRGVQIYDFVTPDLAETTIGMNWS